MPIETVKFSVKGMHCPGCETIVEQAAKRLPGVQHVSADYGTQTVLVRFDKAKTDLFGLFRAIELKGYECALMGTSHPFWTGLKMTAEIILGLGTFALLFLLASKLQDSHALPQLTQHMSHGMILLVGLISGFHCIGMCGAFVVGYTTRQSLMGRRSHGLAHLAYGIGKTASYTLLGAGFGLMGALVTFTPELRGFAGILAGVFLVIFGLNMLHLLPHWRMFRLSTPRFMTQFVCSGYRKHKSPFVIGLLNGLMIACGPLQAMYVMAAGTGSAVEGAIMMFLFGAGTLPLLLGFGLITSLISSKSTHTLLQASGFLVVALGLIMVDRGLVLTGAGYDFQSLMAYASKHVTWLARPEVSAATVTSSYQVIRMDVTAEGFQPDTFLLKKGAPVHWIIQAKALNECNRAITIPKLGLQFELHEGEQTIDFTPMEDGVILWSCWMGMLRGSFVVTSDSP